MSIDAIFFDRDGTLILDKHYLSDPNEVELIDGAQDLLQTLQTNNIPLYLFSNQSGIGRGYYTWEDVHACNQRMFENLGYSESPFEGICIAPETPEDPQEYRKPSPKYLLETIAQQGFSPERCYMIGDKIADIKGGLNAGINSIWVGTGKPVTEEIQGLIAEGTIQGFDSLPELTTYLKALQVRART